MRVFRLLPGDKEELVTEQRISTDKTGRATWDWEASDSGQFRIEFEGQTEWGDKPKATLQAWVVGENVGAIRLRGVTILLDKPAYEEGETLHARLVADKPGASVLFTQEANGQITKRQIVSIPGQSVEVNIPLDKTKVPNFFLGAALVQDFEVFQAQTEVLVPPTRQLLTLEVKGDKATYPERRDTRCALVFLRRSARQFGQPRFEPFGKHRSAPRRANGTEHRKARMGIAGRFRTVAIDAGRIWLLPVWLARQHEASWGFRGRWI